MYLFLLKLSPPLVPVTSICSNLSMLAVVLSWNLVQDDARASTKTLGNLILIVENSNSGGCEILKA